MAAIYYGFINFVRQERLAPLAVDTMEHWHAPPLVTSSDGAEEAGRAWRWRLRRAPAQGA